MESLHYRKPPLLASAIETIEALHCGQGAAVTFHRISCQWQDLGAVRAVELRERWPQLQPHIKTDAFFSINSIRSQPWIKGTSPITGLPLWRRRASEILWLNALWVDLDGYRVGLSPEACSQKFLADLAPLPTPNWIASSGNGCWALWQIKPPETSQHRDLHHRTLITLAKKFAHLGADEHSTDVTRVMRIPGSVNTRSNKPAEFFPVDGAR